MAGAQKTVLWLVVGVIAIAGIYYYWQGRTAAVPSATAPSDQAAAANSTLPSGTNTSDASLQEDLSAMDTNISGMSSDTAAIDSSMNDQPVAQDSSF